MGYKYTVVRETIQERYWCGKKSGKRVQIVTLHSHPSKFFPSCIKSLLKCWSVTQPPFWVFSQLYLQPAKILFSYTATLPSFFAWLYLITPKILFVTCRTCQPHHHPPTSLVSHTITHPSIPWSAAPSPTSLVSCTITHPPITWLAALLPTLLPCQPHHNSPIYYLVSCTITYLPCWPYHNSPIYYLVSCTITCPPTLSATP